MQLQQPTAYHITQTHNLAVQNILANQQPKHILFHKLEHIRILFLTGLVVAGRNFIKLYAIFSNLIYEELASYNIHQDIEAISSWQKTIVIQTRQKIVGLIYEDSMLKNAFMLSLQFLPLNRNDVCHCAFDRLGHLFAVYVKGFLLLCFSDSLIAKYKTKPQYRQFSQIVNQDVKWNRPEKAYIQQIIKIRISDFQLSRLSNMNICNQSLYFIGLKNLQKPTQTNQFLQQSFYHIQCQSFFISHDNKILSFLAKKDPEVRQMIPYVYNKQMQCLFLKQDSIYVQVGREMVLVDELGTENYHIVYRNNTDYFTLWVRVNNVIRTYYRCGNAFVKGLVELRFHCDGFLLKEDLAVGEGTVVYCSETGVGMLRVDLGFAKRALSQNGKNGNEIEEEIGLSDKSGVVIHKSLGNVVDFQFWKNSLLIIQSKPVMQQSGQIQIKSKLYQLRRSLTSDPKPYITHQKKNFLQTLLIEQKLKSIKSVHFRLSTDSTQSDNLVITQAQHSHFTFYRQLPNQTNGQTVAQKQGGFEKILEDVDWYFVTTYKQRQLLVLVDGSNGMWVEVEGEEKNQGKVKKVLVGFPQRSQKQARNVFCVENYLMYQVASEVGKLVLRVCEVFTGQSFDVEVELSSKEQIVRMFSTKKRQSIRKKDKTSLVIQLTIIFRTSLQISQLYPQPQQLTLSYRSPHIPHGVPYLSNHLSHQPTSLQRDKYRSITCPQYILNQYHPFTKQLSIKASHLYQYNTLELLFLVNSEDQLMVYRKVLSFMSEVGYVYVRLVVPVNVVKAFRSGDGGGDLGEGVVRVGSVVCCRGQLLEHNMSHISYFQMDAALWAVEKDRVRMVDLKPLAGSNQTLFKQQLRKDSKDLVSGLQPSNTKDPTLQQNIQIFSNFILTPTRTMMRKQLLGLQLCPDYIILYSKTGFQVLNSKDMKLLWICNLSLQNPQRKQVIINIKAFEHYIAVSYYDYIQDQNTEFKSIKFKFRVYSVLAKKKILERAKSTDQPVLHIRAISADRLLLATASTLYIYQIKGEKALQPIRTRIFSKRFGLGAFSYIPEVMDEKLKIHKPCYMMCGNQYGGLSFYVGRWMENDNLREMWYEKLRAHVRNVQLFHYGQQLKALVSDQNCNLIIINLKPDSQDQPAKAQKLADINVGSKSNVFRIRHQQDRKIYASFQDGTIKSISAIKLDNPEISLIDFQQQAFCKQIPFMGGFNLRTSSLLTQKYRTYKYVSRGNVLDCQILEEFFAMTSNLKEYILQKSELKVQQLKAVIRSI